MQKYCQVLYLDQEATPLKQNERSALRYIAGYVCRHLRKKIEKENDELKEEMVLCLMSLVREKEDNDCGTDEHWTYLLDRGGLWHVKENTYQLFCAIEYRARPLIEMLTKPSPPSKGEMIKEMKMFNSTGKFHLLILK